MTTDTEAHEKRRNSLYLSHHSIRAHFERILCDMPDMDGGNFYTRAGSPTGWRDGLDAEAGQYLKGFRAGVKHALAVVLNGGGVTVAGMVGEREDGKCAWCDGAGSKKGWNHER